MIGVGVPEVAGKVAEVAQRLGTERTFVIHGVGVDELPLDGSGVIHDVTQAGIESRAVVPERLGLQSHPTARLAGAGPADNARIVEAVAVASRASGATSRSSTPPRRSSWRARSVQLEEGVDRAALTIDAGLALELLAALRAEQVAADAEAVAGSAAS